jgi:hypothetical protein
MKLFRFVFGSIESKKFEGKIKGSLKEKCYLLVAIMYLKVK